MRLAITCMKCLHQDDESATEAASVEMRDDGLYSVTCARGHTTLTAIQEQKFEILFDLGAMALIDGYTREAVSSIAAALERFLAYYVEVLSLKHGVPFEAYNEAWKTVSRQSERQLGAFLFLYLLENKKSLSPSILEARPSKESGRRNQPTWTEFRNSVIHAGYIPTHNEVLQYGDLVYQFIYRLIGELRGTASKFMHEATIHHLRRATPQGAEMQVVTMTIPTLISLTRGIPPPVTFADALKGLERYRRWMYHSSPRRS